MKKMFPKHARNIIVDKARNVFEIAVSLHNKGHRSIVMVIGSDRVAEFEKLLNTYNGVEARHGYYGFDNIEVISAGERDPDAEGVTGMSASKMRAKSHLKMILTSLNLDFLLVLDRECLCSKMFVSTWVFVNHLSHTK